MSLTKAHGAAPAVAATLLFLHSQPGLYAAETDSDTTLPAIEVKAQAETEADNGYVAKHSTAGSKTDTPLIETPQAISVIDNAEFTARAAQNITQAVAYTPGLLTGMFGPSTRDDYFNLRGFDAPQYLDGTRLAGANYANLRIDPYGLERIEVLRGPASVLYGQNPPGGLINMVSKRPTAQPFHELQMLGGSFGRVQGALDFSGPLDDQGQFLYRLTALGRGSDSQVDFSKDDRYFVAPSFTWQPDANTSLTFLSHYQKDDAGNTMQFLPYQGSVVGNPNGRLPTSTFLGEPGFDHYRREQFAVGYAFEHRFNRHWAVRQNLRYADVKSDYPVTFALGFVTDNDGVPVDYRTVSRLAGLYRDQAGTFTLDNHAQADFAIGDVRHTALLGLDFRQINGDRQRGFGSPSDLDMYSPVYGQPFAEPQIETLVNQQQDQIGLYGQDQIQWRQWIATIGVRYDWASNASLRTDYYDSDTDRIDYAKPRYSGSRQDDAAFTYRTGLSYLFDSGVAPYFNYSESFEPTAGSTFAGTPFKPTTGQQFEIGVKYQPPGVKALITLAAFELTQQNVVTPDPDPAHVGFSIQTGAARSRGIELEGKARLEMGLDVTAALALIESQVTKTNEANQLGKKLSYTPETQGSLWLDYTQPSGALAGLGLGGGVRYTGSNYGDLSNSQKAPSYTLIDASVHYELGKLHRRLRGARLGVNISNLFDREYVATCGEGSCYYGDRRNVLASLRYIW
ncbi:TonB-dependent siderophore receptor [Methylomonas sp. MS20]|uniref:TonB-dependent siderophore receptor n=1 Tax=unclassified Methylomonas TaxID=2608980 RepID=UPI0028A37360|nr:TonB-dependent siderophore receptor [Methylomonas sp. MV1]MDT4328694.1 TonB-dependent siderophore receptor [Methylomonas sp. MV1]